MSLTGP